jgi:hypothetical protein
MNAGGITSGKAPVAAIERVFEEDLAGNLLLGSDLAPRLCRGCEQYHLSGLARRAVGLRSGVTDRRELTGILRGLISERAGGEGGPIDILIAGSADTALLAVCANAALSAGGAVLARCRFTVIDRCETPLRLCEAFGRRHGLDVTTQPYDLVGDTGVHRADFTVFHSVLRFVPPDRQVEVVAKLLGWLKAGGRLIASSSVGGTPKPERDWDRIRGLVRQGIESGSLRSAIGTEDLLSRLGGTGGGEAAAPDSAALISLFRAAGASVETVEDLSIRPGEDRRNRMIAVLSKRVP